MMELTTKPIGAEDGELEDAWFSHGEPAVYIGMTVEVSSISGELAGAPTPLRSRFGNARCDARGN